MPGWANTPGRSGRETLPSDWDRRVANTLAKEPYCQWGSIPDDKAPYGLCQRRSQEVDHYGDRDDHSKLRGLCTRHHAIRSGRQGAMGLARARKARDARVAAKRAERDRHPGLIEPPADHPSRLNQPPARA